MSGKGASPIHPDELARRRATFFVNPKTSHDTYAPRRSQEELRAMHEAQQQQQQRRPSSPSPAQHSFRRSSVPPSDHQAYLKSVHDRRGASVPAAGGAGVGAAGAWEAVADTESENSRDEWMQQRPSYDYGPEEPSDAAGGKKQRAVAGGERPIVLRGAAAGPVVHLQVAPALSASQQLFIKEGEILLQKGQLTALHLTCRVLDEANKVMCEVINKCASDQMRHPEEAGYELKREDIESVNECQDRILEATGIGFLDPTQELLRLAHANVHRLEDELRVVKEQLRVAKLPLPVLQHVASIITKTEPLH